MGSPCVYFSFAFVCAPKKRRAVVDGRASVVDFRPGAFVMQIGRCSVAVLECEKVARMELAMYDECRLSPSLCSVIKTFRSEEMLSSYPAPPPGADR